MTERKAIKAIDVELKQDTPGGFLCTFSRFEVVDLDADVTLKSAFKNGERARIAQWAHNWSDYTIGKGAIIVKPDVAQFEGLFNLKTDAGRNSYEAVKDAEDLQEWSYGYDVLASSTDKEELARYPGAWRILKELRVHEVSPVMLGAGVGTGTDAIKSLTDGLTLTDHRAFARAASDALGDRYKALAAELRKEGRAISAARRGRIAADVSALREFAKGQSDIADDLDQLLAETDPEKARIEAAALAAAHLRLTHRLRELQPISA